jgi:hypothetical protein
VGALAAKRREELASAAEGEVAAAAGAESRADIQAKERELPVAFGRLVERPSSCGVGDVLGLLFAEGLGIAAT